MSLADKLIEIQRNVPEVYNAGIEAGAQAEYDRFWDAIQANGTKKLYQGAFRDAGWTDEVFRPKYDIVPEGSYCIYQTFANSGIVDLKGCLERQGVKMDFSKITNWNGAPFQWSKIETFPVLDCSNCTATNMSYANFAKHIDMFILKADGSTTTNFAGCVSLKYIRFGGVIGTAINFAESKNLSLASIEDIISHLSTTTNGLSVTLSLAAVNKAFEIAGGDNNGSISTEWTALVATRSNWTINLV